jgi:hypothetical protein
MDYEVADTTVAVVVDVRAADTDSGDLNEHFIRARLGYRPCVQVQ